MARQSYSADIKAAALADLYAGDQPAVVAQRYGLPAGTVRQWKNRMDVTADVTQRDNRVTTHQPLVEQRQARIGDLIIRLLEAKLRASERLAHHFTKAAWLDTQSAGELAALGQYLDQSAFAIGDRLAGRAQSDDHSSDGAG